ncbi:MAG: hypothetical protein ABR591_15360 [Candidatus Velthaea sp.]
MSGTGKPQLEGRIVTIPRRGNGPPMVVEYHRPIAAFDAREGIATITLDRSGEMLARVDRYGPGCMFWRHYRDGTRVVTICWDNRSFELADGTHVVVPGPIRWMLTRDDGDYVVVDPAAAEPGRNLFRYAPSGDLEWQNTPPPDWMEQITDVEIKGDDVLVWARMNGWCAPVDPQTGVVGLPVRTNVK